MNFGVYYRKYKYFDLAHVKAPQYERREDMCFITHMLHVAQLSQKDRAAGWVSYGQKWKTGTGRLYLRTL